VIAVSELPPTNNYNNLRQLWDTRYTPNTPALRELMILVKAEYGGTWREVSELSGIKLRQLRRIYKGEHLTVAFRTLDAIFCRSNHIHRLLELEWLTVEELLERGIWRPQFAKTLEEVMRPQGNVRDDDGDDVPAS